MVRRLFPAAAFGSPMGGFLNGWLKHQIVYK
jgi:hypothetical protein